MATTLDELCQVALELRTLSGRLVVCLSLARRRESANMSVMPTVIGGVPDLDLEGAQPVTENPNQEDLF